MTSAGVSRQRRRQAGDRPSHHRPQHRPNHQRRRHERQLAQLDPDVERQQRQRDVRLGQPHLGQRPGEAQPVQRPEGERHPPRPQAVVVGAPICPRLFPRQQPGLARHQHDAEGDGRLDRRLRHPHHAQGGQRQRQAVGHGEGGDRSPQLAPDRRQQQQPQHERQVVDAAEDVLHPQLQVGGRHPQRRRRRGHQEAGAIGIARHDPPGDGCGHRRIRCAPAPRCPRPRQSAPTAACPPGHRAGAPGTDAPSRPPRAPGSRRTDAGPAGGSTGRGISVSADAVGTRQVTSYSTIPAAAGSALAVSTSDSSAGLSSCAPPGRRRRDERDGRDHSRQDQPATRADAHCARSRNGAIAGAPASAFRTAGSICSW